MNAEQEPHAGADQQKHHSKEPLGSHPLRLAPEGAFSGQNPIISPVEDNSLPTHYDIRAGGDVAVPPPPFTPGEMPERQQPPRGGHRVRNTMIGAAATAAGVAMTVAALAGFNKSEGQTVDEERGGGTTSEVTPVGPPKTVEPTTTPTEKPEIKKSTPYNFINQKVYLDGALTVEIEENLPTMTEGPANIYPESIHTGGEIAYPTLSGVEVNSSHPESAQNIVDGIDVGLLIAWSTQKNIPDEQRDLITTADEPKEEQLRKLALMKERSSQGEEFKVTMRVLVDDSYAEENVEIDLGDKRNYKIDALSKPPVQLIWDNTTGGGIRVGDNGDFRIEVFSQFRGGNEVTKSVLLANQVAAVVAYMPELVVDEGEPLESTYKRPIMSYYINEVLPDVIAIGNRYFILGVDESSNGKDWPRHESVLIPLP